MASEQCDMKPYYESGGITIYHGDCREIMAGLQRFDAIVTDPPYPSAGGVPIVGAGVGRRIEPSISVGEPWGFSLNWIEAARKLRPCHWVVFCNYRMLGPLASCLPPSNVFVWRKSNAPRMARNVPRMDCEFILWSRSDGASCGRMGEFQSSVLDVPMPQAGVMARERELADGSLKAAHPCQKPIAVVSPFLERLGARAIIDPFMGTGTTLVVAKSLGLTTVGIEIEEKYCEIAVKRLAQEVLFTS